MDARETNSMMHGRSLVRGRAWEDAFRLPCEPLLSSASIGWQGIHLEYHRQPPYAVPEHQDAEHEIYIPHFKQSQKIQWMIDGCRQQKQIDSGVIAMIPANVSHSVSWDFEAESTMISLEPGFVTSVAYESVTPDQVELLSTFPKPDPLICQIGLALRSALATDGTYSRLYAESAATLLAAHLLQYYSVQKQLLQAYSGLPTYKLRQAIAYIHDHLDQNLSLIAISTEVGLSQYHFSRLFKQATGVSVHQYVLQCRVKRAQQLLLRSDLSVTEVAFQVGFANPSHLSHHFKRIVGVSPKMFLNQ